MDCMIYIKLMSLIESIPQQDSLLENSQMKLFLNSQKRSSLQINLRRASLTSYTPQIKPPNQQRTNLPQAGFSPSKRLSIRSSSTAALSKSRYSSKFEPIAIHGIVPRSARKVHVSNISYKPKVFDRVNRQKNENLQAALHKINFQSLLSQKSGQRLAVGLTRRESVISLRPKVELQLQRTMNKKYSRNCPFEPGYLQSDYLH